MKKYLRKILELFFVAFYLYIPMVIADKDFYLLSSSARNNFNIAIFVVCAIFIYKLRGKDSLIRCSFVGIICIMPLITKQKFILGYGYIKIYYVYILALIILIFLIQSVVKKQFKFSREDIIVFIYIILVILSAYLSKYIHTSFWGEMRRWEGAITIFAYIILFYGVKIYKYTKKDCIFIFISSVIVSVIGILQFYGLFKGFVENLLGAIYDPIIPCASTLGNQNMVGSYITLMLPLAIIFYIIRNKVIYMVAACIDFVCLLCTNTKSAWLAFVYMFIFIIIYFIKNKSYVKEIRNLIILFTASFLLFSITGHNSFINRIYQSTAHDLSSVKKENNSKINIDNLGTDRGFIWIRAIKLIPNHPLIGSGPDTFMAEFTKKYRSEVLNHYNKKISVDKAHNEYLQIAVTTGIPSLMAYLCLLFSIFFKGKRILKDKKYINDNPVILILFISCTGYVIQAFFNISVVAVAPIYWTFLGVLSCHVNNYSNIKIEVKKIS